MKPPNTRSDRNGDLSMMASTEPLWTVEEVANYLRLKQETVRIMARAKKLPALKIGKVWRFRFSDVKEMLRAKNR